MPEESWAARDWAHLYGVAGSRVVPTTRIGAAPFASMRCGAPVALTGQYAQFRLDQAKPSPKTGEACSKEGSAAVTSVGPAKDGGRSRQFTAALANIRFAYLPLASRS